MIHKIHILQKTSIVILLLGIAGSSIGSDKPAPMERTITAVRNCMDNTHTLWSNEWQIEYINTIRKAIESHQDSPKYARRLEILQSGFRPYWEELKKSNDRSLFEVQLSQIRWYTENLMTSELPGEEEKKFLKNQYEDLWNYATGSLLTQFQFLDPNIVKNAKRDHLNDCFSKIEAPLIPIFLRPMTETQIEQIKQRWHDLRYVRVDLWRSLGANEVTSSINRDIPSINTHSHYLLTQRSLVQLMMHIRAIVTPPPDYYIRALDNQVDSLKNRDEARSLARRKERYLEKENSSQLLQTEYISFLLAALLETSQCFQGSLPKSAQKETVFEQQDRTTKGGDAYDLRNNVSIE